MTITGGTAACCAPGTGACREMWLQIPLQLHYCLTSIPFIEEFEKINQAFASAGNGKVTGICAAACTNGNILGTVRTFQYREEYVIRCIVTHKFLDVPPCGNTNITLLAPWTLILVPFLGLWYPIFVSEFMIYDKLKPVHYSRTGLNVFAAYRYTSMQAMIE